MYLHKMPTLSGRWEGQEREYDNGGSEQMIDRWLGNGKRGSDYCSLCNQPINTECEIER